ncbi:hypothetical protein GGX14DRAFT_566743 [Mycena pura]|uniref:Uncharacterized protein n=1 Tax=Mycena pura TaxID=153505 RepID=A0AAD6VBT3_9AGAR|nr:hypothetical protein GGX14DRAFT_566743 [Mycena pura]
MPRKSRSGRRSLTSTFHLAFSFSTAADATSAFEAAATVVFFPQARTQEVKQLPHVHAETSSAQSGLRCAASSVSLSGHAASTSSELLLCSGGSASHLSTRWLQVSVRAAVMFGSADVGLAWGEVDSHLRNASPVAALAGCN